MGTVHLKQIIKNKNKLRYEFEVSNDLKHFFSDTPFEIHYNDNIENVPDGILAIPFIGTILPTIWLTDSKLYISEIDKDYYQSIPAFKKGYIEMFPDAAFGGELIVNSIKNYYKENNEPIKSGCFFSGGLDATTTLIRHIEEKPELFTIWGADVAYDNRAAWEIVWNGICESANQYHLNCYYIRTSFRIYDNEVKLNEIFSDNIHTGWWYAFKHGISLISHVAPYAYLHNIKTFYMASSNCPEDGPQSCASDPRTDNFVKFCGASIVHDAFELNRQKKARVITDFKKMHPSQEIPLRVCYKSTKGNNCCKCEKCYRTMVNLWVEGEDPKKYGFDYSEDVFLRMKEFMTLHCNKLAPKSWTYAKNQLINNWDMLESSGFRDNLDWIREFDFLDLDSNLCRQKYMASWKFKRIIVKLFPHFYKLYVKLRGYSYTE